MLAGLMSAADAPPAPAPRAGAARKGAVGAISSAVSTLRANAVIDIAPEKIRAGGLSDRLEDVAEEDAELRRSIAAHGQQVPVLVRPHPEEADAWQIVYGRRRVLAARDLGIKVKALVRDLDDAALVMAQGQENAARLDLSFIEKASFARQMLAAGYDRAAICDALAADKTLVSRMLSVVDRIPDVIVRAIGAAHGVGRPRWLELADLLDAHGGDPADVAALVPALGGGSSAQRFDALLQHLKLAARKPRTPGAKPEVQEVRGADGARIARARRAGQGGLLSIALEHADGFDAYLLERIPELHARWKAERE